MVLSNLLSNFNINMNSQPSSSSAHPRNFPTARQVDLLSGAEHPNGARADSGLQQTATLQEAVKVHLMIIPSYPVGCTEVVNSPQTHHQMNSGSWKSGHIAETSGATRNSHWLSLDADLGRIGDLEPGEPWLCVTKCCRLAPGSGPHLPRSTAWSQSVASQTSDFPKKHTTKHKQHKQHKHSQVKNQAHTLNV